MQQLLPSFICLLIYSKILYLSYLNFNLNMIRLIVSLVNGTWFHIILINAHNLFYFITIIFEVYT